MSSAFNQPFPSSCFGICNPEGPVHHSASTSFPTARLDVEGSLTFRDEQRKQEVDDLLSQAMNGLTFQERQEQQEILHGVVDQFVEDEAFMDRALQDLDLHLAYIKQGSVYEMAEQMDPVYVNARPFQVMFVRGNRYDTKKAANQMLRFFESKLELLFGRDKLFRDITIADLNEDDIACLKVGALQIAGRDRSGRQVFVFYARLFGELIMSSSSMTLQNYLRAQHFTVMTALQSEETQLRGTITIWYAVGDWKDTSSGKGYLERMRPAEVLPQKIQAIHLCTDDLRQYALGNIMTNLMPKKMRARFCFHFGSQTECEYKLLTYGILSGTLSVDADGRMNLSRHLRWVHVYANMGEKLNELERSSELTIKTPKPKDVLCTRGKVNHQEGNQHLLALVNDCARVYYESGKDNKMKQRIVGEILEKIEESGGRFLKPQTVGSELWVEVPLVERRKKVMQAFRNRRRVRRKHGTKEGAELGMPSPQSILPLDAHGRMDSNRHQQWVQSWKISSIFPYNPKQQHQ